MSDTHEATLDAMLDIAEAAIRDAPAFEHEHGLATRHTRKLPADALRVLRRWRQSTALHGGTAKTRPEPTAPNTGSQGRQAKSVAYPKEPSVPVAPTVSIRVPSDLRQQVEEFGREHRWTFGETTRVALEQLVGYDKDESEGQAT